MKMVNTNNLHRLHQNYVITSGGGYVDIDVYASCIAYRELLNLMGIPAKAVSSASLNESVPNLIREIPLALDEYIPTDNDLFIILDVSDPVFFDEIVDQSKIVEIIDHHAGHESYWREMPEIKTQIENIGSVATKIYEKFVSENMTQSLSADLCKLLTVAIVDNTLNLRARITTNRDRLAFNELMRIGNLDSKWTQSYLEDCERQILKDLKNAIKRDTKDVFVENLPSILGQLTIFNHDEILSKKNLIKEIFPDNSEWVLNLISLKAGKSFLLTDSKPSKDKLERLFKSGFNGDVLELDEFMLRKEIIAFAQGLLQETAT